MLQIILTRNKKLISDILHCGAKNWSRSAKFLDKTVDRKLGIWLTDSAKLAILRSSANECHSTAKTTDTQSCRTLLASPLDLQELSSVQIRWINTLRVSLNLLALTLVTGSIGAWIGSTLHLLVVSSSVYILNCGFHPQKI